MMGRRMFLVGRRNWRGGRKAFLVGRRTVRGTTILMMRPALAPVRGPFRLRAVVSGR